MREDFNKLLVERERIGSGRSFHEVRRCKIKGLNDDYFGGRESMKKRHHIGYETKSFNENLNPLKGFLHSKIGKNWDKVYSELRKTFDARSVINQHILEHLYQYVDTKAVLIDGKVMTLGKYSSRGYVSIKQCYSDYYVCPKDGTLKKPNKEPRRSIIKQHEADKQREADKVFRVLDDNTHLRFVDGLWYAFDILELPPAKIVYQRPGSVDKFRISGYGDSAKYSTWAELSEPLKRQHGIKTAVEGVVYDEFTKQQVFREAGSRGYQSTRRYGVYSYGPYTLGHAEYYANKRTANHKMLEKLGIDGTATFDGDIKMSHREASKYRKAA